eukprot:TRINITY_DN58213_c0_g1_i1.p1 TRINITY_DN58213_c0_g1~~TRINITY_DN58213_c0_g1_i1.p1  ORF type:complete len:310 (+),score=16.21 TRINITY_DN58213_c0_g1_i1:105-1034(+)
MIRRLAFICICCSLSEIGHAGVEFGEQELNYYLGQFMLLYLNSSAPLRILEVGSGSVNRSKYMRAMAHPRWSWFGVDIVEGEYVDHVLSDPYVLPFGNKSFDVAVCINVLEHVDFFWLTFLEMARVTNSFIFIVVPGAGMYHPYPRDSWRFQDDFAYSLSLWAQRNHEPVFIEQRFSDKDYTWGVGSMWQFQISLFRKYATFEEGARAQPLKLMHKGFDPDYVHRYARACWLSGDHSFNVDALSKLALKCCTTNHAFDCFGWSSWYPLDCCTPNPASRSRLRMQSRRKSIVDEMIERVQGNQSAVLELS